MHKNIVEKFLKDKTFFAATQHNFVLKTCGPIIENEHLWVCTKFICLHSTYPYIPGTVQKLMGLCHYEAAALSLKV